jgi:hypothetical protein
LFKASFACQNYIDRFMIFNLVFKNYFFRNEVNGYRYPGRFTKSFVVYQKIKLTMKEIISFLNQNLGFIITIIAVICILIGRIWSDNLNRGEITEPQLIIKKGKYYKVINTYVPKSWTEDWILGSIICLESYHSRFFVKYTREIYVSGDRIRFTDDGPGVGLYYQAIATKKASGSVIMKPVKMPPKT